MGSLIIKKYTRVLSFIACCIVLGILPAFASQAGSGVIVAVVAKIIEQRCERVYDAEAEAKIADIANTILASERSDAQAYEIRLLKTPAAVAPPDSSAFCIPGNILYVCIDLLQQVQSEHELAAVLAHAIAHDLERDVLGHARDYKKYSKGESLNGVISKFLLGDYAYKANWTIIPSMHEIYLHDIAVEIEQRTNLKTIRLLRNTHWDPVGYLTYLERSIVDIPQNSEEMLYKIWAPDLGRSAIKEVYDALVEADIPVNRRHTANWVQPIVQECEVNGLKIPAVMWRDQVIVMFTPGPDAEKRCLEAMQNFALALSEGAGAWSFNTSPISDGYAIIAHDTSLFTIFPADAALLNLSPEVAAQKSLQAIKAALIQEELEYR